MGVSIAGFLYYGNYTDSIGLIRIDKELSISNSTNIGEVSGGAYTGGVVGRLGNAIDSAGTKIYAHSASFNLLNCSNNGHIVGGSGSASTGGGVAARFDNAMAYAGISGTTPKAIADTAVNKIIIKYCLNAGRVTGDGQKGGIVGWVENRLGASDTTRGGKANVNISYNINTAKNSATHYVGGIMMYLDNDVRSDNCYLDVSIFNNFNIGDLESAGSTTGVGGIISCIDNRSEYVGTANVNIAITGCYNYSTVLTKGRNDYKGGVVGVIRNGNFSRVNLLNNYSAYKRNNEGVDIDNNIYGRNPNTDGANVGEKN